MSCKSLYRIATTVLVLLFVFTKTFSQTEVEPWGNITGIRVDGQLVEFESSLQVISNDWLKTEVTALERQHPKYNREGNNQVVTTKIDSFYFTQQVEEDIAGSSAKVAIQFTARKATDSARVFFSLKIPERDYENGGKIIFRSPQRKKKDEYEIGRAHV